MPASARHIDEEWPSFLPSCPVVRDQRILEIILGHCLSLRFRSLSLLLSGASSFSGAFLDMTGNGALDVVVSNDSPTSIAVADFQRNGSLDLLVSYRDGGQSYIYLNDGDTHFPERIPFGPADARMRSAIAVDLDGDGTVYGFAFGEVDADGFVDIAVARSSAPGTLFFGGPTTAGTSITPEEGLSTP